MSSEKYSDVNEKFCTYGYNSFIPCDSNPVPDVRIMNFLTVGPFVMKTAGSFESEHMYERDKILLEDYLSADGGEKNILPRLGDRVTNNYYGGGFLTWEKGFIKWNSLRFDREEDACDPALYATEQRNAVYYAAFYVECEKAETAVISYVNSGSTLFVNGEEIDFRPFGRVKGLDGMGYCCPVHFNRGKNLVLFKLRPGYIADTMDISMPACLVLPVIAGCEGLFITSPVKTLAFTGSKDAPRMVFPFFAYAADNVDGAEIFCDGMTVRVPQLRENSCALLRAEILSNGRKEIRKCSANLKNRGKEQCADMYFETEVYDGFEGTEHVFSDFHFDTTYHQEQRTYALGAFHITKRITENLERIPEFKAILSEIDYLHPYYTLYPHHRKTIKKAFEEGRAEADCFYNQPNDLTSSGEAFVRNLIYGQLYHRDVMGRISRAYVPGDVFGHFSQITQVCKKGGCDLIRWGKHMMGVDRMFRHMSPDGTTLIHDKGITRPEAVRLGMNACSHSSQALSYVEAFPREENPDWMKKTVSHATYSVFSELSENINNCDRKNKAGGNDRLSLTSRDITQHHSGVLLTRTDFKQANRLCENLLISAEKLSAAAFIMGAKYPEKAFDKAWRQLLCAQHHDSITGTNNEISFVDLMAEYRECAETAADVLKRAAGYITSCAGHGEDSLFVFNTVPENVSGKCYTEVPEKYKNKNIILEDCDGRKYKIYKENKRSFFLPRNVPATGFAAYYYKEAPEGVGRIICGSDRKIENRYFSLTVSEKNGGIVSVYDKTAKKEIIDPSAPSLGNAVYALREIHDRMETQHELYTTGQKLCSDEYPAQIKSEKCSDYQKLTIKSKLGTLASLVREITLFRGSRKIDFKTVIEDYNGEDDLFTAAFPVDVRGGAVIFDDRFAPHVSTRSKKYMSFQTHQYASFSGCRVLPVNRWFGVGPSVTVKIGKNSSVNIGMTALIRRDNPDTVRAADRLLTALTKKGIPVTPYPDTQQHGGSKIIHFNEDIYETDTRFVLAVCGDGNLYAEKLMKSFGGNGHVRVEKLLKKYGTAAVYTTDSDNEYKKSVDVFIILSESREKMNGFISGIEEMLSRGRILTLENGIVFGTNPGTADDYGVSLINNGNVSCSVEGKNTLNMMLFHTASFYGNAGMVTGGKELVPEKKTHIFTYELYPHTGSYREAHVYRESGAFNEPLFSVAGEKNGKKCCLPEKYSFLKSEPGFEITAFKAGGYPFASMTDENAALTERGVTLRGFETDGISRKVRIKTGFDVVSAGTTNLLDGDYNKIKHGERTLNFTAGAHGIETVSMVPVSPGGAGENTVIGTEKDITEPTYIRSWEHDMGAVPTGFLRFAATLDRKCIAVDEKTTVVNLNAVNNSSDSRAEVKIDIICSAGLCCSTKSTDVVLGPRDSKVIPLTVVRDCPEKEGQVTVYYEYGGQRFTDVFEFGYFNPSAALRIEENRIICTVSNPTEQRLDCSLMLITPVETWSVSGFNPNSYGEAGPLARSIVLQPGETKEYTFETDFEDDGLYKSYYAAVKLCCNGRIHFAFADRHGPRHNIWAHEFINEIAEDNGSIKKLLRM